MTSDNNLLRTLRAIAEQYFDAVECAPGGAKSGRARGALLAASAVIIAGYSDEGGRVRDAVKKAARRAFHDDDGFVGNARYLADKWVLLAYEWRPRIAASIPTSPVPLANAVRVPDGARRLVAVGVRSLPSRIGEPAERPDGGAWLLWLVPGVRYMLCRASGEMVAAFVTANAAYTFGDACDVVRWYSPSDLESAAAIARLIPLRSR